MTQRIEIPLTPRTKKNSGRIIWNRRTNRPMFIPSQNYADYEKECGYYLKNVEPFLSPCNLRCLFYMPTRRKVDLSNLISAISDILVHYGILMDDNSNIIKGYDGSRVIYDKGNGHTIIEITEFEESEVEI